MYRKTAAELWLEPCGLGRHDIARVGNADELVHGDGIEGEGHFHLAGVNAAGEFSKTADTAHEVNSLVCTEVLDAKNLVQYKVRKDSHIQNADGV